MATNEFEKGKKFSFNQSIDYADKAVISKHILKKEIGNIYKILSGGKNIDDAIKNTTLTQEEQSLLDKYNVK